MAHLVWHPEQAKNWLIYDEHENCIARGIEDRDNAYLVAAAPIGSELAALVLQYAKEYDTPVPDAALKMNLRKAMFAKAKEFQKAEGGG